MHGDVRAPACRTRNYSLAGVATGNEGFFRGPGVEHPSANVDTGDARLRTPTAATNESLDTTIAAGGGTTSLTLATRRATRFPSAKAVPRQQAETCGGCAALAAKH